MEEPWQEEENEGQAVDDEDNSSASSNSRASKNTKSPDSTPQRSITNSKKERKQTANPSSSTPIIAEEDEDEDDDNDEDVSSDDDKPSAPTEVADTTSALHSSSNSSNNIAARNRGYYTPLLQNRLKRDAALLHPVIPLPAHVIGGLRDQIDRTKQCNCKRSHCLKLYCECFAAGIYCKSGSVCNCVSCKNCVEFDEVRAIAVKNTLIRNGGAFRPRSGIPTQPPVTSSPLSSSPHHSHLLLPHPSSSLQSSSSQNHRGCNCRKSACLKKYCECFQNLLFCNPHHCKCIDCQNVEGNAEREDLVRKRRTQQELAAAQAITFEVVKRGGTDASASASAAASVYHEGFLPPSLNTVPAFSGPYASLLAFGLSGAGASADSVPASSPKPVAVEGSSAAALSAPPPSENKLFSRKFRPRKSPLIQTSKTNLEEEWSRAIQHTNDYFQAMQSELQSMNEQNVSKEKESSSSTSYPRKRSLPSSSLHFTIETLKKIEAAMEHAKDDALQKWERKEKNSQSPLLPQTDELLSCTEVCPDINNDDKNNNISDNASKELSVLCAQDTVLMRHLARTINDMAMDLRHKKSKKFCAYD